MNEKYQDILSTLQNLLNRTQNTLVANYRGNIEEKEYKDTLLDLFNTEEKLEQIIEGVDTFVDLDLLKIIGELNDKVTYLINTSKKLIKEKQKNEN